MTEFHVGDTVTVISAVEGRVQGVNGDGTYDVQLTSYGTGWIDDVPEHHIGLVKRALPPEPPIGSLVQVVQDTCSENPVVNTFVRKPNGRWYGVYSTGKATFDQRGYAWPAFGYDATFVLNRNPTPVKPK